MLKTAAWLSAALLSGLLSRDISRQAGIVQQGAARWSFSAGGRTQRNCCANCHAQKRFLLSDWCIIRGCVFCLLQNGQLTQKGEGKG